MANKIYQGDIENVSSSEFGKVKIEGETLQGTKAKEAVADMAKGGITERGLTEKLKQAGVSGSQISKRKQIIKAVSGGDDIKEKKPVVPKYLRALDKSRAVKPLRPFQTIGSLTNTPASNTMSKAPTPPPRINLAT